MMPAAKESFMSVSIASFRSKYSVKPTTETAGTRKKVNMYGYMGDEEVGFGFA